MFLQHVLEKRWARARLGKWQWVAWFFFTWSIFTAPLGELGFHSLGNLPLSLYRKKVDYFLHCMEHKDPGKSGICEEIWLAECAPISPRCWYPPPRSRIDNWSSFDSHVEQSAGVVLTFAVGSNTSISLWMTKLVFMVEPDALHQPDAPSVESIIHTLFAIVNIHGIELTLWNERNSNSRKQFNE